MAGAAFRQIEIERILKAAQRCGGIVEIDLRSMKVHIVPGVVDPTSLSVRDAQHLMTLAQMVPDGKENWDDDAAPEVDTKTRAEQSTLVTTPAKLAKRWMCSERHVRNIIKAGELPAFEFGKSFRIKWSDVEAFEMGGGSPAKRKP